MDLQLIVVPYDSAQRERRMGRGPGHILDGGLIGRLTAEGHTLATTHIDPGPDFPAEIATGFAVMSLIAAAVRTARNEGRFPLILGGNCGQTIGAIAGAAPSKPGLIWFDAHGDFNTPETSDSGFLDGMGLSIAAGHCWRRLAGNIEGFTPVPENHILLVGARDLDPAERGRLSGSEVRQWPTNASDSDASFEAAVGQAFHGTDGIHLHLDLDVLDPAQWPANQFPAGGGLTPERLAKLIRTAGARVPVVSAYVGSYDPTFDPAGRTRAAALDAISAILRAARAQA